MDIEAIHENVNDDGEINGINIFYTDSAVTCILFEKCETMTDVRTVLLKEAASISKFIEKQYLKSI